MTNMEEKNLYQLILLIGCRFGKGFNAFVLDFNTFLENGPRKINYKVLQGFSLYIKIVEPVPDYFLSNAMIAVRSLQTLMICNGGRWDNFNDLQYPFSNVNPLSYKRVPF